MKRKLISFILALLMLMSLSACGGSDASQSVPSAQEAAEAPAPAGTLTPTEPPQPEESPAPISAETASGDESIEGTWISSSFISADGNEATDAYSAQFNADGSFSAVLKDCELSGTWSYSALNDVVQPSDEAGTELVDPTIYELHTEDSSLIISASVYPDSGSYMLGISLIPNMEFDKTLYYTFSKASN